MNLYDLCSSARLQLCKAVLKTDNLIYDKTDGRKKQHLFSRCREIPYIGSSVRVIKKTDDEVVIEKNNSDTFKIMGSTDFHLDSVYENDNKTITMFLNHLEEQKPDLVVITGDIFTFEHPILDAVQFAEMMEKTGVYWCCVYGNHECREEYSLFKYSLFKCISKYPHCLTRTGKKDVFGVGNYSIDIMSGNKLLKTLYMFDSGRDMTDKYKKEHGCPAEAVGYDFLKNNQIEWFKKKAAENLVKYKTQESFMFMHIPLCEYKNVFTEKDGKYEPSGDCDIYYGNQFESVGCSPFNSGMFDAAKENGTEAVFCGHDHINDFYADYKGVKLVYFQPQDYNIYTLGSKCQFPEDKWVQGVTVININNSGSFDVSQEYNSKFL